LITIFDGQVLASNAAGSLTLTGGQSAVAEAGKAPVLQVVVRLLDVVQRSKSMDADSLLKEILNKVNEFAGDASQHDDLTLIVVSVE